MVVFKGLIRLISLTAICFRLPTFIAQTLALAGFSVSQPDYSYNVISFMSMVALHLTLIVFVVHPELLLKILHIKPQDSTSLTITPRFIFQISLIGLFYFYLLNDIAMSFLLLLRHLADNEHSMIGLYIVQIILIPAIIVVCNVVYKREDLYEY